MQTQLESPRTFATSGIDSVCSSRRTIRVAWAPKAEQVPLPPRTTCTWVRNWWYATKKGLNKHVKKEVKKNSALRHSWERDWFALFCRIQSPPLRTTLVTVNSRDPKTERFSSRACFLLRERDAVGCELNVGNPLNPLEGLWAGKELGTWRVAKVGDQGVRIRGREGFAGSTVLDIQLWWRTNRFYKRWGNVEALR